MRATRRMSRCIRSTCAAWWLRRRCCVLPLRIHLDLHSVSASRRRQGAEADRRAEEVAAPAPAVVEEVVEWAAVASVRAEEVVEEAAVPVAEEQSEADQAWAAAVAVFRRGWV